MDDDDDDKISYDPLYTTAVNIWCSYGQEFGVFFWLTVYTSGHLKSV